MEAYLIISDLLAYRAPAGEPGRVKGRRLGDWLNQNSKLMNVIAARKIRDARRAA